MGVATANFQKVDVVYLRHLNGHGPVVGGIGVSVRARARKSDA